jgi:hypothetical protein
MLTQAESFFTNESTVISHFLLVVALGTTVSILDATVSAVHFAHSSKKLAVPFKLYQDRCPLLTFIVLSETLLVETFASNIFMLPLPSYQLNTAT